MQRLEQDSGKQDKCKGIAAEPGVQERFDLIQSESFRQIGPLP